MKKNIFILISIFFFISCEKEFEAPVPEDTWDIFNAVGTSPLPDVKGKNLEGIYSITYGENDFGGSIALKWICTVENGDTVYTLSGFTAKNQAYFISSGRQTDSVILLNGYYRKMINTETGIIRLKIQFMYGARLLSQQNPVIGKDSIVITGNYGPASSSLDSIKMIYDYPLRNDSSFVVLAHRCGGRTSDLLPAAENSVAMVLLAPKLGATGIELDVRLTSDGVPVVYHDERLNDRLIQPNGMMGNISNYSFAQLRDLVRLTDGQQIPTLTEILGTALYNTQLKYAWLDIKYNGNLQIIHDIQAEFTLKAAAAGRDLKILIGIPDDDVQSNFILLNNFAGMPSINERYDEIHTTNSSIWGSPWALGVLRDEVTLLHSENRKVFVWTMDQQAFIEQYLSENLYDGILTNYPCTVAYCFYAQR
jgi:glycerophosphoryl diester phosphodiesterase